MLHSTHNLLSLTKFENHIPCIKHLPNQTCTISMGNRNSSNSKVHGQVARVASTEPGYDPRMGRPVAKFRDEYIGKPNTLKGHGAGVYSEQQYNTPLENDETFTSFIRRGNYQIRTVSQIGREHSNVAPAPPSDDEVNGTDNQNEEFSNFIQSAKKKLRTTPSMRKNGSFKSG